MAIILDGTDSIGDLGDALAAKVAGDGSITQVVALTQAEYDALTPVSTTLYVITA